MEEEVATRCEEVGSWARIGLTSAAMTGRLFWGHTVFLLPPNTKPAIMTGMKSKEPLSGLSLRAAVAALLGWTVSKYDQGTFIVTDGKRKGCGTWIHNHAPSMESMQVACYFPHYEADLNAMNEVEQLLVGKDRDRYYKILASMFPAKSKEAISASANARALAFVAAMAERHEQQKGKS